MSLKMTNLMNELILEAQGRAKESLCGGGGGWRDTEFGYLHVTITPADYMNNGCVRVWRKSWTLDGKRIAAKKLEAM